jgi:5-methyltetrahydropteroyltriglutamate--homocysteine methyltransferase
MPDRILTTHAGSLPRSEELRALVFARADGEPYDAAALDRLLRDEVAAIVRKQVATGIDVVNDGELGKTNFQNYVRERIAGFESRPPRPGEAPPHDNSARDAVRFGEYLAQKQGGFGWQRRRQRNPGYCIEPLRYVGREALAADLANLKAAIAGQPIAGAFVNANTPGTIEHWLVNQHYPSQEAFLYAIGDVMREEYAAIVEAGFILHLDDPDLPDAWQMHPEMSVDDYRAHAALRVDVLNHALRGIPKEKVTLHVCWGSFHGPHQNDIPLENIVDIVFRVNAGRVSIEASNPVHEHEWLVFKQFKLPDGVTIIPGVVGHATDFIEHPQLVAQRLRRYADLVGRDRVMAGTDCGLGPRVGHPEICWAKLESLVAGAHLASG